jgi:hypothetical protein
MSDAEIVFCAMLTALIVALVFDNRNRPRYRFA